MKKETEVRELENMPEYILAYIAPMACGSKERGELIRRQQLGIATGERLNTVIRMSK